MAKYDEFQDEKQEVHQETAETSTVEECTWGDIGGMGVNDTGLPPISTWKFTAEDNGNEELMTSPKIKIVLGKKEG